MSSALAGGFLTTVVTREVPELCFLKAVIVRPAFVGVVVCEYLVKMKPVMLCQESASFSCEGPGSKYFRLRRSWASDTTTHFCYYRMKVAIGNM